MILRSQLFNCRFPFLEDYLRWADTAPHYQSICNPTKNSELLSLDNDVVSLGGYETLNNICRKIMIGGIAAPFRASSH